MEPQGRFNCRFNSGDRPAYKPGVRYEYKCTVDPTRCGSPIMVQERPECPTCPYKDEDWGLICDDCHTEHYQFTCDLCEEYGDVEDQHKMLIVWDGIEAGIPSGLYKVTSYPYYSQDLLGGGKIHEWAVERLDNVPGKQAEHDYPCGHLCADCQQQYADMFAALKWMNC